MSNQNIIFLEYSLILKDVVEVLREYGHNLYGLNPRSITVTKFVQTCMQHDADWVFGINFSPEIAYLCSRVGIPYVSWTIDPLSSQRFKVIKDTNAKMCICFAHDIRTVAKFRDVGINAQHMILAAPNIRRKRITDQKILQNYSCDASFVGNSMVDEIVALEKHIKSLDVLSLNEKKQKQVHLGVMKWLKNTTLQFSNSSDYQGIHSMGGWSSVPKILQNLEIDTSNKHELLFLIDGSLAALHRQNVIYKIQNSSCKIHVWGDEHWSKVHPNYQRKAEHNDELTTIYCASGLNIDIPRLYQRNTINMRVFDAMLVGGAVLSERNDAILELFEEDHDIILYTSPDELNDKIKWWSTHPKEREKVALQGMKTVHENHLISHRVNRMLQCLKDNFYI